jgi:hypothetical protein
MLAAASRALDAALLGGLLGRFQIVVHLSSAPLEVGKLHPITLLNGLGVSLR